MTNCVIPLRPGVPAAALLILVILDAGRAGERIDIDTVWAGHPVGFALLTSPPHQFAAYYDAERRMTVAQRTLDEKTWRYTRLPSQLGWDSHNRVIMAIDKSGRLHVAGNMHCVPLVYFRSEKAWDAASLVKIDTMVDPQKEQRVTYPVFMHRTDGRLVFRYRNGRSGSGDDLYNIYDETVQSWKPLVAVPVTSGEGKMNAYCSTPSLGPDGLYHMVWVWRDTPDCATNHDLSYARSRDLEHWETAGGTALELPIKLHSGAVVDSAPAGGGLINGGFALGFDRSRRPVISYSKYDSHGNTQVYVARFQDGNWMIRQVSDWSDYRWDFHGGGSIDFEVRVGTVRSGRDGQMQLNCNYPRGNVEWILDENSLEPVAAPVAPSAPKPSQPRPQTAPQAAKREPSGDDSPSFPGLGLKTAGDSGSGGTNVRYQLRWHTLGPNRDRPRTGPLPPPSTLQLEIID